MPKARYCVYIVGIEINRVIEKTTYKVIQNLWLQRAVELEIETNEDSSAYTY